MSNISMHAINEDQLNNVNAGTFTKNYYPQWVYERAGFKCDYHTFAKDEFILNGKVYHETEANAIMASMGFSMGVKHGHFSGLPITIVQFKGQEIREDTFLS